MLWSKLPKIYFKKIASILLSIFVAIAALMYLPPEKSWAASMSWDGGASTANWADALNWSTDTVPTADDDVLIDVTTTINIAASTTVNSLVLGNSGGTTAPILNFSYNAISNGALIIDSGNLHIYSGGKITHTIGTSVVVGTINIDVQIGNFIVDSGGLIDTNGAGYAATYGTGKSPNATTTYGASGGAGYGGSGGYGSETFVGGTVYGSITNPVNLGSGSGNTTTVAGAKGGGAIYVTVGGTFTNDGIIRANGNTGALSGYQGGSGGGSGGSVNISCTTFEGAGTISSNGGNGGVSGSSKPYAGGGGGGRIAINYTSKTYTGTIEAKGGRETLNTGRDGGPGSIFTKQAGTDGDLLYDNTGTVNTLSSAKGMAKIITSESFDNITLQNLATLEISSAVTIANTLSLPTNTNLVVQPAANISYQSLSWASTIVDYGGAMPLWAEGANMTVPAGATYVANTQRTFHNLDINGVVTGNSNTTAETYKINLITTGDLTISGTGSINLTGKGFSGGAGDGHGQNTSDYYSAGGGGGYGGAGGVGSIRNSELKTSGGSPYGLESNPTNLGSSGGYAYNTPSASGAGGGALILSITGEFQNNGNIYVNGNNGSTVASGLAGAGGGSGGSINITTGSFTGNGNIYAKGGNGAVGSYCSGGGGGGGRIAILSQSKSYTGTFSVNGGTGHATGDVGTLYPTTVSIVDNSTSNITINSSTVSANISAIPLNGVTDTGFYWGIAPESLSTQVSLGASNSTGIISTNLTSLTPSTTYYFKAYAIYNGETTYGDLGSFITLVDNATPTALDTNITGETDIYPGKDLTIQSIYSDGDGAVDLDKLYLQINNPSGTDIEYYATSTGVDQTGQTPTAVSGAGYLSSITYDIDFESPTANDITVTWYITPNWTWTRDTTIAYGVKAVDIDAASSAYDYTASTYTYENRLDFTGTVTAVDDESNNIPESSWTPASFSVTFSGIKVVFFGTTDIYPNDSDFNVMLVNDSASEWYDNTSSGENISIAATTSATTNTNDEYIFSIINIPAGGSDASATSFFLKTDNTVPVISSLTSSTHPTQTTWYTSSDITISWSATDNQSGIYKSWRLIDKVETQTNEYIQANGTEVAASGTYSTTLPSEGTWYIHLLVEDNEGLITTQTFKIMIDSLAPIFSSITSTTHPSQTIWYSNKTAIITWNTTDTSSNVEAVWRLLDQTSTRSSAEVLASGVQAQANMTWTTPDLTSGTWYLHLVAKDSAEQTTYAKYTLKIDLSTPDIIAVTGNNNGVWQNTNSGPIISWTDPNSLSDNIFYITNNGTNPTSSNYAYTTTSPTYDLPNQGEGETIIKVRAITTAGIYSIVRSFTIRYDSAPPANVTNLTATPSETSIVLSWTNPSTSDLNRVIVMKSDSKIPTSTSDGTKIYEGTNNTYTDSGLTNNATYYYTIFSLDALSNRSSGTTTQATTTTTPPAQQPTEQPSVPEITEDTTIINIKDLPEEQQVSITVDQKDTTPSSTGEINIYTGQSIDIEIPASAITSNTTDTQSVILVLGGQAYTMEYNKLRDTYSATVDTPAVKGLYTATIQTVSKDKTSQLAITMTLKVAPHGYVYTRYFGNEIRLSNANVSLFKKVDGKAVLWESSDSQTNPQVTGETGEFSFFVEPGEYKFVVEVKGYTTEETDWITVEGNVIEQNIQMTISPLIIYSSIAAFIVISFVIFYFISSRKYKKI